MNIEDYIEGGNVLLYIETDSGWIPVGCLTSNPFGKSTESIETTVRGNGGYRSYMPGYHNYSLSFSGVVSKNRDLVSYNDLDLLQENRVIFGWRISSSDGYIAKEGVAFISELTLDSNAGEWVSFSCTLTPYSGGLLDVLVWSENGLNIVENKGKAIQVN